MDVRGAAIEAVCVQVALQTCRQHGMPPEPSHNQQPTVPASSCDREDMLNSGVNLQQVFDKRFRVMQGCPPRQREIPTSHQMRIGSPPQRDSSARTNFRDPRLETLLFAAFLLLHRPIGRSRVSREDLLERFDKFAQGKWCDVFEDTMKNDRGLQSEDEDAQFGGEGQGCMSNLEKCPEHASVLSAPVWRQAPTTRSGQCKAERSPKKCVSLSRMSLSCWTVQCS